jgi:hypothetical protein
LRYGRGSEWQLRYCGAFELEDADGQVSEGGHGLGAVAGPDLGGVFGVGDVADVVQGFDLPVAADPGGELGGVSLAGGQAGDGVDGDSAPFLLAGQGLDPAGNAISSSSAHGQPRRLPLTFSTNALVSIRHPGQDFFQAFRIAVGRTA